MSNRRGQCEISFEVNGESRTVSTYPMARLLDVLRQQLGVTGPKEGCGEGECGSCSVLIDGALVNSCLVPALHAQGTEIVTVEGFGKKDGLAQESVMDALQQAFLDFGGAQCGICTPGILMASCHLLQRNPRPTVEEIKEGLAGNLCRCTGYTQICEAVAEAADGRIPRMNNAADHQI
jgi:aerobic carbon-monoxide dehydrogenase small subunit